MKTKRASVDRDCIRFDYRGVQMRLRRVGVRAAMVLTMIAAAVLVPLAVQAPGQAAQAAPSSTSGTAGGWVPNMSPLGGGGERVYRNQSTWERDGRLADCPNAFACIAVGQGDGMHTVFYLTYCTERRLTNFINAGAINNQQTGNAKVLIMGPRYGTTEYPVGWGTVNIPNHIIYDANRIKVC